MDHAGRVVAVPLGSVAPLLMTMQHALRGLRRFAYRTQATITYRGHNLPFTTRDVSGTGVAVEAPVLLQPGALVVVTLHLPDGGLLTGPAIVRRADTDERAEATMAVAFTHVSAFDARRVERAFHNTSAARASTIRRAV